MKYVSTRHASPAVSFSEALERGLAPDGGLYVPEVHPHIDAKSLGDGLPLPELAERVLAPYMAGDPLAAHLKAICRGAFSFEIPLRPLKSQTAVLELFHGPTCAFKDVGARFLAECLALMPRPQGLDRLVLVATSGDTGSAVGAAFHRRPGFEVAILFPKGRISPRQEKQLTGWGDNVRAYAVRGTFDDCQKLVKVAFNDETLRRRRSLVSANSINIGRLIPQQVYFAAASLEYHRRFGAVPGFVVPTGNLGNGMACLWAKRAGVPIGTVMLATNANRSIPDYFTSGEWRAQPTVSTLANAMDVGNPSNVERLLHLYPKGKGMKEDVQSMSVSDAEIRRTITSGPADYGEIWCPHTATAVQAREKFGTPHWIVVATASPAKFESIVEPLIKKPVPLPPALAALLGRPSHATEISPDLSELTKIVP
jgi:threonine synthase